MKGATIVRYLSTTLCLALLFSAPVSAAPPDKAALVAEGYDAFYNLEYEPALKAFEAALALDPADPELHNHLAQTLLFRELFRNGALESEIVTGNNSFVGRLNKEPLPDVERSFHSEIDLAIRLCNQKLAGNSRDPAAMHTLAVAMGLRANYGFLVRKSWVASLRDSSKAQKLEREVTALDPGNFDARLIQGAYDYIVGSLSWHMKVLGLVAGYRGDKQRGIATLEEVAEKGRDNHDDAEILLCALYRREGQPKRAIPRVLALTGRFPRNFLIRFELAQMCGAAGLRTEAMEVMLEIARLKMDNAPGYARIPDAKIAYETGNLQFWFGDLNGALENLRKATASAEGMKQLDLNTGALAFMRQGQILDLRQQHGEAVAVYRRAMEFAPEAEAAKESKKYISNPYRKNG